MAATTETRTWNAILSTTLANYRSVLHDNIFRSNIVLFWLNQAGKKRTEDGGHRIEETLLYAQNTGAMNYSGYELLDTTPQEGMTKAFADWKQGSVPITISRKEERQNSGRHRLLNLLESKAIQAELTLKQRLNAQLIGDPSSATTEQNGEGNLPKHFAGIAHYIQKDPTTANTVEGIDQSSESWWRNKTKSAVASWTTNKAGLADMRTMYNDVSESNDHPDFILADQGTYEAYESMLQADTRYLDTRFGDAGFINLRFKGAVVTYDEHFDTVGTPQTFSTGEGVMYFLNSRYLSWVVDKETDFMTTPFVKPYDQDARVAHILLMGNLTTGNRRRGGVIFSIAA